MKSLGLIVSIIGIIYAVDKVSCENNSYSKSCFVRFLLQANQIDEDYKIYINDNEPLSSECDKAVSLTLDAIRTSSKDPCIAKFLTKKDVAEILLRKYLLPQLDNNATQVVFDEQFTTFRQKVVDFSTITCANSNLFSPDVAKLMNEAKSYKKSNAKQLECLQVYIKKQNQVLTEDCQKVVDYVKDDFYKKMDSGLKNAFVPPNDQLYDLECSKKRALDGNLFERVYFFVVLATSRDMNEKQISVVAKNAESAINSSQKMIFECINF